MRRGERAARCQLGNAGFTTYPTSANFDVDERAVHGEADAAGKRGNPFGISGRLQPSAEAWDGDNTGRVDRRPIEILLDAQYEVAELTVVADLDATDEAVVIPIEADTGDMIAERTRGPSAADVAAEVESRPTE